MLFVHCYVYSCYYSSSGNYFIHECYLKDYICVLLMQVNAVYVTKIFFVFYINGQCIAIVESNVRPKKHTILCDHIANKDLAAQDLF